MANPYRDRKPPKVSTPAPTMNKPASPKRSPQHEKPAGVAGPGVAPDKDQRPPSSRT
jgi:hypothetical protein